MNKNNIDLIIYHWSPPNGCSDGSIASLCAYLFLHKIHPNKKIIISNSGTLIEDLKQENTIIFYPAGYGRNILPSFKNRNVLMCDISFPKQTIDTIIKDASGFLLIDHHESAEKELVSLDKKYKIFDMNHSGAWLTWKYFFPEEPVPLLVKYIQSRDIWTKDMENTDAFAYWFDTIPQKFEEYEKYLDEEKLMDAIKNKGLVYQELNDFYVKNCITYAVPKFTKIGENFYFVVYLNGTILKSDLGNKLINEFKMANFSAVYTINDKTNSTAFSLRSSDKHTNVAEVAHLMGGGGHRNASGLYLNKITNVLDGVVYDSTGQLYKELRDIYKEKLLFKELGDIGLEVIYLNSLFYKQEIGKYLLQTKYYDKEKGLVQEGSSIIQELYGEDNIQFDISVIWSYDGRYTTLYITFRDQLDSWIVDMINSKYNVRNGETTLSGEYHLLSMY